MVTICPKKYKSFFVNLYSFLIKVMNLIFNSLQNSFHTIHISMRKVEVTSHTRFKITQHTGEAVFIGKITQHTGEAVFIGKDYLAHW